MVILLTPSPSTVHVVYVWPPQENESYLAIAIYVHKLLNTSSNAPLKIFEIPVLLWNEFWIVLRMSDGNGKSFWILIKQKCHIWSRSQAWKHKCENFECNPIAHFFATHVPFRKSEDALIFLILDRLLV